MSRGRRRLRHEALQDGQGERRGLARACLREAEEVAPFEQRADRALLDRRGRLVAGFVDRAQERRDEAELVEFHERGRLAPKAQEG
jgi:hypothetical protein